MDFSELEQAIEDKRCTIMDLLPLLFDIDLKDGSIRVTPSCFINEMQMSTEQRLEKLRTPIRKVRGTSRRIECFKVVPDIVIFQNFKPGTKYTVPVSLLNISDTVKPLNVAMEPSPYFTFKVKSDVISSCKVAPGMSYRIEVSFSSSELRDIEHSISFLTLGEEFEIKLLAIGPRPLLDLPDRMTLPTTVIHVQAERTFVVRNIGQVPAVFTAQLDRPFFVVPDKAVLQPHEATNLTVYFRPSRLGYAEKDLKIVYETGEVLSVKVEGVSEEAKVSVSKTTLCFPDTYLGLTALMSVEIRNDSGHCLPYCFKQDRLRTDEDSRRDFLKAKYREMEAYELQRDNLLAYYGVASKDVNEIVQERIYEDQVELLEREDEFRYHSEHFSISPIEGEIWPGTSTNVDFVFAPKVVGDIGSLLYLEVSGLENRIPVELKAASLGPKVTLNVEEIDAQNVYVLSMHKYEIVFINSGPIPATIRYLKRPTKFGGVFLCSSREFVIEPEQQLNILLQFSSESRGKFIETIAFEVVESGKILEFTMIGDIICPLLNLDINEVDFGDVAFGIPVTVNFTLINTSQVSIEFRAQVEEDGNVPAVTLEQCSNTGSSKINVNTPKEFDCDPCFGVVEPYSELPMELTLVSNKVQNFLGTLVLVMWGSRKNSRSIPVKYRCHIPTITCSPSKIEMKSIFITEKYFRVITLQNNSPYKGFVHISTMRSDQDIDIRTDVKASYIEANDNLLVKVIVTAKSVGSYTGAILLGIFGCQKKLIICEFALRSRGPCVDVIVEKKHLGEVPTLTEIEIPVEITNDSPIPAHICLSTNGEFITVPEREFFLPSEEKIVINLQFYGTYAGRFKNVLIVEVENGDTDSYPIVGTCVGHSILFSISKDLLIDLGVILTERECVSNFQATNKGKVHYTLQFSLFKDWKKNKLSQIQHSYITISPQQIEVDIGAEVNINVIALSRQPCEIFETVYVFAKTDITADYCNFYQFNVHAIFVEPTVQYESNIVSFQMDVGTDSTYSHLDDSLVLKNCTEADLVMKAEISPPFFLVEDGVRINSIDFVLSLEESRTFYINFNPPVTAKKCFTFSDFIKFSFEGHPKTDKIPLVGKINYPDITIVPNEINFDYIPLNHSYYTKFMIRNLSPLVVHYNFTWTDNEFYVKQLERDQKRCTIGQPNRSSVWKIEKPKSGMMSFSSEVPDVGVKLALRHMLCPLISNFDQEEDYHVIDLCKNIDEAWDFEDIQKAIDVIPSQGTIEPYRYQMISVKVCPNEETQVYGKLTCHVSGGEDYYVTVSAKSSMLAYFLEETDVDFGVVDSMDVCSRKILLENTGYVPFSFKLIHADVEEDEFKMVPGALWVEPKNGSIKAKETIYIFIKYFPGKLGNFSTSIELSVIFQDSVTIRLRGYGVFPQVHFPYPKLFSDRHDMILLSYSAIAELTYPEHKKYNTHDMLPILTSEDGSDVWYPLQPIDTKIPSPVDIKMALERKICSDHLHPPLQYANESYSKRPPVPVQMSAPPYLIDFGYVGLHSVHSKKLEVLPYYPNNPHHTWGKLSRKVSESGFNLVHVKNEGWHLVFKPNLDESQVTDHPIEIYLHLMVSGGLRIDFLVRAIVSVPTISFDEEYVNFGAVRCGDSVRKLIVLKNSGNLCSCWKAYLNNGRQRSVPNFYMYDTSGNLEPGESQNLHIYFEPTRSGHMDCTLVINVEENKNMFTVRLMGQGIQATVQSSHKKINFETTLPYSENNVQNFSITNTSNFPVEVVFSDFDQVIDMEDDVIRTILQFYNVKKIYLPPRSIEEPLLEDLCKAAENIKGRLQKVLLQKMVKEKPNPTSESHSSIHLNASAHPLESKSNVIVDPLLGKTKEEVQQLISEHICEIQELDPGLSLHGRFKDFIEIQNEPKMDSLTNINNQNFVVLIFYGAPETNFLYCANRTAKLCGLPIYNVDRLIIDALISMNRLATIKVQEEIDSFIASSVPKFDDLIRKDDDSYDILEKKVRLAYQATKSGTNFPRKSDEAHGKDSERGSKKSSKHKSSVLPSETLLNISKQVFHEIITRKLMSLPSTFIIETLDSNFILQPPQLLQTLLECIGNARYIHLLYVLNTYESYVLEQQELQQQQCLDQKKVRISEICNMTPEEYDLLTVEEKRMYREYLLSKRKKGSPAPSLKKGKSYKSTYRTERPITESFKIANNSKMVKSNKSQDTKKLSVYSTNSGSVKKRSQSLSSSEKGMLNMFKSAEVVLARLVHLTNYWDKYNRTLLKPLPDEQSLQHVKEHKNRHRTHLASHDSPLQLEQNLNIGIQCWVMKKSFGGSAQLAETVHQLLKNASSFEQEREDALRASYIEGLEQDKRFTVLTKPAYYRRHKNASSTFSIYNCDDCTDSSFTLTNDSVQQPQQQQQQKSLLFQYKSRDGSSKSRSKSIKADLDSEPVVAKLKFTPRHILEPGEKAAFSVVFLPKKTGSYSHTYCIELMSLAKFLTLTVEGKADTPKVYFEPEMVFARIIQSSSSEVMTSGYYKDRDVFHFGPVLKEGKETCCKTATEKINIKSNSYLPAYVTFEFLEDTEDFSLGDESLVILPNNSEFLSIHAHPRSIGLCTAQLLVAIKNNPRVGVFKIACTGTEVDISVPSFMFFERVPLHKHVEKTMVIRNNGLLPINWSFVDKEGTLKVYVPSMRRGLIRAQKEESVTFSYVTSDVRPMPKKTLQIEFFDSVLRCVEPVTSRTVHFSAEVIDVILDYESDVMLSDVKLGTTNLYPWTILNKSKYTFKFVLSLVTIEKEKRENIRNRAYFKAEPMEGLLKPHQPFEVDLKFMPKTAMSFTQFPVFNCCILDEETKREQMNFTISFTGKVFSSRFELCPPSDVEFNYQLVMSETTKEIVLKNTGRYAFSYIVITPNQMVNLNKESRKKRRKKSNDNDESKSKSNGRASSVSSDSRASKKRKKSDHDGGKGKGVRSKKRSSARSSGASTCSEIRLSRVLTQGIFSLSPFKGLVETNAQTTIKITCRPDSVGDFSETYILCVSDCSGKDKFGHYFRTKAKATVPNVDFVNYDVMFAEVYTINVLEDFSCPEQMGCQPLFIRSQKELYFNKTCLNTAKSVRVKLTNLGFIGTDVILKITEGESVFAVTPEKQYINSYAHNFIAVTFKPTLLDRFQGTLEMGILTEKQRFTIGLSGEGYLPEITLVTPKVDPVRDEYSIQFNPLIIGCTDTKQIIVKNTGMLPCSVLLGLENDDNKMLAMVPKQFSETLTKLHNWSYLCEQFSHTLSIEVNPDEECTVDLKFKPTNEEKICSLIKIYTSYNPFKVFKIKVLAEGYKEDLIFEGLNTMYRDQYKTSSSNMPNKPSKPYYFLNYGHRFINQLHKICFKIKNLSEEHTYKFVFSNLEKLLFIPSVGHLKPLACKDIVATFHTKEPVRIENGILVCNVSRIMYVQPQLEPLSWDERQCFTLWKSSSERRLVDTDTDDQLTRTSSKVKFVMARGEPAIDVVPETERELQLCLYIISDYCRYECDVTEIVMEDTLMFEKRTDKFNVRNTSEIDLTLQWSLNMLDDFPQRINVVPQSHANVSSLHTAKQSLRPMTCQTTTKRLLGSEIFLDHTIRPTSSRSSSLFSSSSTSSQDSWLGADLPFTITPPNATINPGCAQQFTVTFSPYNVYMYQIYAKSAIANLEPSLPPLSVLIKARSLLPLYHFNIEPSDYIAKRRQNREICGQSVSDETKVVEMEVLGIDITCLKKFSIINPTGEDFKYRWETASKELIQPLFQCLAPEGQVSKGKMAEAVFSFTSEKTGVFEKLYTFHIEKYSLRTDFLLVATVKTPCIFFKERSLYLKPTIIGFDITDVAYLKNNENVELTYSVKKSSLMNENRTQKLGLEPIKGTIAANGEICLKITFKPKDIGEHAFNLQCRVERVEKPLVLSVIATCYNVQAVVTRLKHTSPPLSCNEDNHVDLTSLIIFNQVCVGYSIANVGCVGFYYKWEVINKYVSDYADLAIVENEGYVKTDTTAEVQLNLRPIKSLTRKNITLFLKILYGPTYKIVLTCSTCRSKYNFSFTEYNFGMCLVQKQQTYYNEAILEIANNDVNVATIEVEKEIDPCLTVIKKTATIPAKKSIKLSIFFHPLQLQKYSFEIPIIISSKLHKIVVKGEGVSLDVQHVDHANKVINSGPIHLGQNFRKTVRIVNKSRCPISIIFDLQDRLPMFTNPFPAILEDFESVEKKPSFVRDDGNAEKVNGGKGKKKKKKEETNRHSTSSKKSDTPSGKKKGSGQRESSPRTSEAPSGGSGHKKKKQKKEKHKQSNATEPVPERKPKKSTKKTQPSDCIKLLPNNWIKIQPGRNAEFTISFTPTCRMSAFSQQIFYQVQDNINLICTFKSCCVAPEYSLDQQKVCLGTVIKGCFNEYVVKLFNTGDMGGRYKWNLGKATNFTITPVEGYITPSSSVNFTVRFQPANVHCFFKWIAYLHIDNYKQSLNLELTGTCIHMPPPEKVFNFSCPVRESQKKQATLNNPTGYNLEITPSITGRYFSMQDKISIPSKASASVEITYSPLQMTELNKPHEGSVFLAMPGGQGVLYHMIGVAGRPNTTKVLERTISTKRLYSETLNLNNWLPRLQQFNVINEVNQHDPNVKVYYKLSGLEVIQVPPLENKEYIWSIYPLNEGSLDFFVKFRNMETKEYIVYEIQLIVKGANLVENIVLSTCARQTTKHTVKLENPINKVISFHMSSSTPDLNFEKSITLRPYTQFDLVVEYAPLCPANEFTADFEVKSEILGSNHYSFTLRAFPSVPEPAVRLETPLGQLGRKIIVFNNTSERNAEFTSTVSDERFSITKLAPVPAGEQTTFEIYFEPDSLGATSSMLVLLSPAVGEYRYPLLGNCVLPKPQGPYTIKTSGFTGIPFKNPFAVTKTFHFSVDPPIFVPKTTSETVKAKTAVKIMIILSDKAQKSEYPMTGKLVVTCDGSDLHGIKWTFYLQT